MDIVNLPLTPPTSNSNRSSPTNSEEFNSTNITTISNSVLSVSQKANIIMSQEEEVNPFKGRQIPSSPVEREREGGGGGWEDIRELDDVENWTERTRVITKHDHQFYSDCAQEFVTEIVESLPVEKNDEYDYGITGSNGSTNEVSKTGAPPQQLGAEYNYMNEFSDQDFQSSSSQFDVDYLERVSSNNNPLPSTLARESLYVKFDPLVGNSTAPGPSSFHPPPPTMSGDSLLLLNTPPSQHTSSHAATSITSVGTTPSLQHATPASNLLQFSHSPNNQLQQTSSNIHHTTTRTLLDASPSSFMMASPRVLGSSNNDSILHHQRTSLEGGTELVKVLKYSEADLQQIIIQIRQECQIELERQAQVLREEQAIEISQHSKKMERLVKELQNLRANSAFHTTGNVKIEEEINTLKSLCEEHKATENRILEMYEKLKEESRQIEQQRDQALSDFNSLEKSFAEFHQRHIKAREILTTLQKSETSLQNHITELESKVTSLEQLNTQLQEETTLKIHEANKIYDKLQNEHTSDVAVMKANVKKMTIQISSLEGQLQQKEQEKLELTQICEDLMKELGSK